MARSMLKVVAEDPNWKKRSSCMGDAAYIIGVIGFFILCALYVAALDRM